MLLIVYRLESNVVVYNLLLSLDVGRRLSRFLANMFVRWVIVEYADLRVIISRGWNTMLWIGCCKHIVVTSVLLYAAACLIAFADLCSRSVGVEFSLKN